MSTQRKSVKQLTALISMSCLMVLILTSCRPPESKAAVNPLQLAQAKPNSPVAGIEVRGNLSFPNQQELYFSTTGTIEEISVKKGDQINEGQLLARLDNTTQRLTVDSAQFDVSKAKNALAKRVCPTPGRTVYEFLNGPGVLDTLEAMQAELEKADVSVVNQEYDEVSEELSLARDDLERAKRILLDSYIRIDSHGLDQATLIQLSLDLEKSRIALEKAKEELRKTEIYAPFGGIINDVPVKEGDVLSTVNYTTLPIVQLVDPNVIEVEGLLDEVDRCRAKIGDEADIMVDVLPDIKLKGEVNFISEVGTVRSGGVYYRVTINVEPPFSRELKHGMGATARIFPKRGP
jgi:HlyD family secretion protein